jgi:hypothetical protein
MYKLTKIGSTYSAEKFFVQLSFWVELMKQRASKIVNNCFNTNIYSYLETSDGQSLYQYLNVVHFFNTSVN